MIFPLTHENMEARRWPVLTTILVLLNVLVFLGTSVAENRLKTELQHEEKELIAYWQLHPELETPPPLAQRGFRKPTFIEAKKIDPRDFNAVEWAKGHPSTATEPGSQAELDRRAEAMLATAQSHPARSLGYVPKQNNLLGLITSQFVHGGVLHLVFNMWFMWLCACNLEDRWGRAVFLPVYLLSGVVAALTHKLAMPDSDIPMIGASGAVAGAMGAFLVTSGRTRIRFFHWIFFRPGTFSAPAWVMLPLWLAGEVFWAVVPSGSDGVAHFAHIGGFIFGLAVAGALVLTGVDKRLDSAQEKSVTVELDSRLAHASALLDQGRHAEALAALEAFLSKEPGSIDGYFEYLRAALAVKDTRRMASAYSRLIDLNLRANSPGAAADFYLEAATHRVADTIALRSRAELASRLVAANMTDVAMRVYASILEAGITDIPSAKAGIAYVKLLLANHRHVEARRALDVLDASNMVPELRAEVASLRGQTRGAFMEVGP